LAAGAVEEEVRAAAQVLPVVPAAGSGMGLDPPLKHLGLVAGIGALSLLDSRHLLLVVIHVQPVLIDAEEVLATLVHLRV
jgi:hypothetical protein